jgi:ABC-type uncharacterized transport system permease subunit
MSTNLLLLLSLISAACYFTAGFAIGLRLFGRPEAWRPPRWVGITIGLLGSALHTLILYHEVVTPQGLNLGFFNAGSLVAWSVILVLLLSALTKPVENLGIVLLPFAAIAIILELRFPEHYILGEPASWGLGIHVLVSLLAYSLLTLASMQAILLAVQDHHLHSRHPGGFVRALPPLQTMETLLFELIGVGFFLLSLALVSGFVFLENMFAQHLVHKTVLSVVSWIVFAGLLWGRFRFGWRGRTAIRGTLVGFAFLLLAYFGTKAVVELILHR